ncbi:hypothetical protein [Nonomuraea gerenzanensis]|uniref:Uncharacterized protein n=1 Tax=Nonomuraea gerenzanensis TaxID=93944 RepID=A0A1M4EF35_9ACTN|nr:hypothetical protein [Nonomuraea gerenzanensis]UBU09012.1 hypothetical protein LCN96_32075 [Nonomuraea gerenzanensis]SBO97394.1 hypothetical protein BN4615_P6910 [Nonomuraea gerenzanensis]
MRRGKTPGLAAGLACAMPAIDNLAKTDGVVGAIGEVYVDGKRVRSRARPATATTPTPRAGRGSCRSRSRTCAAGRSPRPPAACPGSAPPLSPRPNGRIQLAVAATLKADNEHAMAVGDATTKAAEAVLCPGR